MLTTMDKAIAGGIVSFLANFLLAHYHITLPADMQTAMTGLIVAIIVWATPNVEKVLDNVNKPAAQGGPSGPNFKPVIGFFIAVGLVSVVGHARAADLPVKPRFPAYIATPCTQANCSGLYAGFNLAGIATNANVLAGGINGSLAGGGQNIGLQAGYQFWNGAWFFGPEVGFDYTYGGTIVPGQGVPKWLGYEIVKFGAPISSLFGGITPANATGLPAILVNSTISPYLFMGAAQRNWGTGIASGGGITFLIPDIAATSSAPASGHWFLDARYTNIQYTGGNTVVAGINVPQENLISVGLNYKF